MQTNVRAAVLNSLYTDSKLITAKLVPDVTYYLLAVWKMFHCIKFIDTFIC